MQKGLDTKSMMTLDDTMCLLNDLQASDDTHASAFFLLTRIKQEFIDQELYEECADFKALEDINKLDIPFVVRPLR